ncbi:UNVERIFIED_ORG: hypothetical protein J2Y77_003041 [Pseudomonas lini]
MMGCLIRWLRLFWAARHRSNSADSRFCVPRTLVCISVSSVTATGGSALTAGHFWKSREPDQPKVTKNALPHHSVPRLGSAPSGGAEALWLLSRFSKVTRCKSGTISGRYRSNGYAPNPLQSNPKENGASPTRKKRRFLKQTTVRTRQRLFHSRENQNSGVYFTENIRLRGSPKLLLPLSWL